MVYTIYLHIYLHYAFEVVTVHLIPAKYFDVTDSVVVEVHIGLD